MMEDTEESPPENEPERTASDVRAEVLAKLDGLPTQPGCYLFLDHKGGALYVGKAKNLRSRVRSYFQEGGSDARYFIPILRRLCADLETVVTATEKEAAVLENELIKKREPRFNVKLRDDKDFLCLRLDETKPWPRLETVRRPAPDHARYFGPYHSATSARRTLHLVNKYFHLRTCSDADFESRKRPCLQYQIKRCPGPCVLDVREDEYKVQAKAVGLFLEGRHDELTRELEGRMQRASQEMEFESAAIYRDQLHAITNIRENQRVVLVSDVDQDVIGLYREGSVVEIEILFVRSGRVSDAASYSLRKMELPDEEILAGFLTEFYGRTDRGPMPDEVLVPTLPDGADGFAEVLSEKHGRKVALFVPQRGPKKKLLEMARENAEHAFKEKRRAADDIEARLEELREKLRLPVAPVRIECCDISHLGGENTVGSIVALENGKPDKKRYRSFVVKTAKGGDDYAAMYEVLARRFRRAVMARSAEAEALLAAGATEDEEVVEIGENVDLDAQSPPPPPVTSSQSESESETETETEPDDEPEPPKSKDSRWDLPDLFIVDGGRGQLAVALAAARDLGVHDLPIVGLAKEKENVAGEKLVDRVYLPGQKNGIPLRSASSTLFFLGLARDEAHRFANYIRKRHGKKSRFESALDNIPGIGPKVKAELLKSLGSIDAIRRASDEVLLAIDKVNKNHVKALRQALPNNDSSNG